MERISGSTQVTMRENLTVQGGIQVTTRITEATGTLRERRREGGRGIDRLDIIVRVDPDDHEWHETTLGPLKIDPITEDEQGNRILLLRHRNRAQLGNKYSRRIILNEEGLGSQQLKRSGMRDRWLQIDASSLKPIEALRPEQV